MPARATDPRVPVNSIVLGYGPMLPLVLAAIGVWALPPPWPFAAIRLAIVWAAMVLVFIAGVRRGFGFGFDRASTAAEIATSIAYFVIAGLALLVPVSQIALGLLILGFALAAILDTVAARHADAPAHFAHLRPAQLAIGAAALAVLSFWVLQR